MPSEKEIEQAARIIEAKSYQWHRGEVCHETELDGSGAWFKYVAECALRAAEAARKEEHRQHNDKLALEPDIENIF